MTYSIIQKSKLEGAKRLDAEYYQPEFLESKNFITDKKHLEFRDVIKELTDYHANGSYETLRQHVRLLDEPDYALMIRTVDLEKDNFDNDVKYISKDAYNFLKKTKIFGEEIIINKIGSAGSVYLMPKLEKKVSLGMNQFMIRTKDNINADYVYAYLKCKYGGRLIAQLITGTVPNSIDKESIRSIKIPIFSKKFQDEISEIIKNSNKIKYDSLIYYSQAEALFLDELKIKNLDLEDKLSYVVNLSEAEEQKREDAEYFQPKYRNLIKHIKKNCNGVLLGDLVSIKKGVEPGAESYREDGARFIRVSSISKYGINDNNQKYLSEDLYNELKEKYGPKKGEILLTKDASLGIAYVLKNDIKGIISGGILRLKLKDKNIEDEYLALCLNSLVGQMHAERDAGGSIIKHWKPDQIKNVIIPVLPKQIQQKISSLVSESFEKRIKAKELLEEAKRKVEEMIEEK